MANLIANNLYPVWISLQHSGKFKHCNKILKSQTLFKSTPSMIVNCHYIVICSQLIPYAILFISATIIYLFNGQKDREWYFHLLIRFPNLHNGWVWARLKPRGWNFILVFHAGGCMGPCTWTIFTYFPGASAEARLEEKQQGLKLLVHLGMPVS